MRLDLGQGKESLGLELRLELGKVELKLGLGWNLGWGEIGLGKEFRRVRVGIRCSGRLWLGRVGFRVGMVRAGVEIGVQET